MTDSGEKEQESQRMGMYPQVANDGFGSIYARALEKRIASTEAKLDRFEGKLDKLLWVLSAAAISFGSAAVMLGLNLAIR